MMLLIQYTLVFSSVLLLVALGGCFSERSGIINIGLEGIMVIGALGGVMVLHNLSPQLPGIVILLLTVAASIAAGMIYSLLLAVASINFKADQTLVGTAMNMLGLALATVIAKAYNIATTSGADNSARIAFVENKKALALVEGTEFNWFMVLAFAALAVGWVVLYKTRFGLRLMACGEHPQAADSVGINVKKMRYSGVLISGAVGGLGGIAYVTAGVSMCNFEVGVAGFGFLALAVMIFGQWKPLRIGIAALLFGFFRALANVYSGFDFLTALNIPKPVYNMLPYIISLIVLAFTSKKSLAPKAEGIPYDNFRIARVIGVNGYACVAEDGFRAGRCADDGIAAVRCIIANMPKIAGLLNKINLRIGNRRFAVRTPVDDAVAAVNQTFFI